MYWKFSNIFPLLFLISSAFLWLAILQIILIWIFTIEASYLWKYSRHKVLKYKGYSAKGMLLFMKVQADSQLWGKSSGI